MMQYIEKMLVLLRPCVHKAFQNQDQDQAQVKNSSTMDFLKPAIII